MLEYVLISDVICVVFYWCDVRTMMHLASTCRTLRNAATDDVFFHVARRAWGEVFWRDALRRDTFHVFRSMRQELWYIERFQNNLRSRGLKPWTECDMRAWWEREAEYRRKRRLRKKEVLVLIKEKNDRDKDGFETVGKVEARGVHAGVAV